MKYTKTKLLKCLLICIIICVSFTTMVCADSSYSVSDAIHMDKYVYVTVEGYIVGQPISVDKISNNNFKTDYSIAIADSKDETNINKMLFIKLDSKYRENFGLNTNSENLTKLISVTGRLEPYFNHDGLKNVKEIKFISNLTNPTNSTEPVQPVGPTNPNPNDNVEPINVNPIDFTGYYDKAKGKTGYELKAILNDIIDNHRQLSYSQVWEALRDTDEDPNNPSNVILLYTGRSQSKYKNGGGVNDWNREHVWAKSHGNFGTSKGAGTDLHHLRPTDVTVNSSRSNKNFDDSLYRHKEAVECFYDDDSFEPRDEVKGDVARMIFYMATRYEGEHGELDLEVVDYINDTKSPFFGKLSTLLKWNKQDPVSEFERVRNDKIYKNWQGNRNPFIDHPEWVDEIWNVNIAS